MGDVARRLEVAQQARERRDWATTYDVLSGLRPSLGTDDLYLLGDAAWWLGLVRESLAICEECHDRYLTEGRLDRAAMMALEGGFNWVLRGEPEIASGWLGRARHLLAEQPTGIGHGYLRWLDAQARLDSGDVEGAVAGARGLRELARDLGEPVLDCFGLALEGVATVRAGGVERGLELLDEALLPVLAGRVTPAESGNLYCQMISVCVELADVERARRWTEATERWCETFSDAAMFVGICRVHRAQLQRLQGDWEAALASASAAGDELAELNVEAAAEARHEVGEIHRVCGRHVEARAAYDLAEALGREPEPGRSLLLLAEGRPAEADTSVRRALAEQADPFRRARLLAAHVEIACRQGDLDAAGAAADELRDIADTFRSPGFRAWADTAGATVLLGRGVPEKALAPLRGALATFRAMRAAVEEATAGALLADALQASGDTAAAASERRAVQERFRRLGLEPPPAGAVPRPGPDHPGELTGREAEVLRAVAEGLSNREVADRLVISEKTVARHLANVFTKLGVSSRTAAVAWLHGRTAG
jgi:DNA-binding CsgD family transcriptional regulator